MFVFYSKRSSSTHPSLIWLLLPVYHNCTWHPFVMVRRWCKLWEQPWQYPLKTSSWFMYGPFLSRCSWWFQILQMKNFPVTKVLTQRILHYYKIIISSKNMFGTMPPQKVSNRIRVGCVRLCFLPAVAWQLWWESDLLMWCFPAKQDTLHKLITTSPSLREMPGIQYVVLMPVSRSV